MDRIYLLLVSRPRLVEHVAEAVAAAVGYLAVIGLIAAVSKHAAGVVRGMTNQATQAVGIADLIPSIPTWWIPESPGAGAFLVAMFILGKGLANVARVLQRRHSL